MKFLLLTYDPQGTDGSDVVPFDEALLHGSGRRWNSPFPKR